jgi:hypothetical protein
MALALISGLDDQPGAVRVRFDIGKNRYLRWQIGGRETVTRNGLPMLGEIKERSAMVGPLSDAQRGRGEFVIPADVLDRDNHWLQITSYREANGIGPAISTIVEVPLNRALQRDLRDLPPPAGMDAVPAVAGMSLGSREFAWSSASAVANSKRCRAALPRQDANEQDGNAMTTTAFAYAHQVDNAPFRLRERPLSKPFFLEALVGMLPNLIPMIAPAISGLSGGGTPGATTGGVASVAPGIGQLAALIEQAVRALGPSVQQILTPENIRQVTQLIQAAAPASAAAPAPGTSRAAALSSGGYSQAMIAPALLAAIPALMPILQQVLSPQTIQSVIDAPQRMTGQVINGITDFARLGIQAQQQLNEHLRALNPGVDDPALHQLLAGMSMGLSVPRSKNYKRVSSVTLTLDSAKTQVVFGREVCLYQQGVALQFPLSVETPQDINDVELMLQIKQADSLRSVHEQSEMLGSVGNGPLNYIPRVEASVTKSLKPQKDYIVVLTLLWQNAKGQKRGTSLQHSISLMSEYRFDRVEESGELIPLSDREVYRDYWHQVWEFAFDKDTRRVDLQTRYYLTLDTERNKNARVDANVRRDSGGKDAERSPRATVKVRSGYEYSLFSLNHLLARLAPDQKPLDDNLLVALSGDDFIERFNQAAQHQGQFRGRPGDKVSLWVFPVFKLQNLILVRAEDVNENGNVGRLAEEKILFPMPAMMQFIGVKQA